MTSPSTPSPRPSASDLGPEERTQTPLRLTSPADVLTAVPHLLGFQPQNSLVAILLVGERQQVRLTLRLDLPPEEDADAQPWHAAVCDQLVAAAQRISASAVVLITYSVTARTADSLRTVATNVRDTGIDVRDALDVSNGRWRSVLCATPTCCPEQGRRLPDAGSSAVHARLVLHGSAPADDRDEVVARYTPTMSSPLARSIREVLEDRALVAPPAMASIRERREVISQLGRMLFTETSTHDDVDVWLEIARGLTDIRIRDVFVRRLVLEAQSDPERVRGIEDRLRAGAVCLPGPWRTGIVGLVAALAWLRGDSVAARAACDLALSSDPDYSLAHLLHRVMDAGLPPERWSRAIVATSEEACVQGMAA